MITKTSISWNLGSRSNSSCFCENATRYSSNHHVLLVLSFFWILYGLNNDADRPSTRRGVCRVTFIKTSLSAAGQQREVSRWDEVSCTYVPTSTEVGSSKYFVLTQYCWLCWLLLASAVATGCSLLSSVHACFDFMFQLEMLDIQ